MKINRNRQKTRKKTGQKRTEADQKWAETDRNGRKQTERDRKRQKQPETIRNKHKLT